MSPKVIHLCLTTAEAAAYIRMSESWRYAYMGHGVSTTRMT